MRFYFILDTPDFAQAWICSKWQRPGWKYTSTHSGTVRGTSFFCKRCSLFCISFGLIYKEFESKSWMKITNETQDCSSYVACIHKRTVKLKRSKHLRIAKKSILHTNCMPTKMFPRWEPANAEFCLLKMTFFCSCLYSKKIERQCRVFDWNLWELAYLNLNNHESDKRDHDGQCL